MRICIQMSLSDQGSGSDEDAQEPKEPPGFVVWFSVLGFRFCCLFRLFLLLFVVLHTFLSVLFGVCFVFPAV